MKTPTIFLVKQANFTSLKYNNRWLVLPALLIIFIFSNCKKQDAPGSDIAVSNNGLKATGTVVTIPSLSDSQLGLDCFNNTWFNNYGNYGSSYKAYYYGDQTRTQQQSFWITAEETETQIDAYNVNPTQANKKQYPIPF